MVLGAGGPYEPAGEEKEMKVCPKCGKKEMVEAYIRLGTIYGDISGPLWGYLCGECGHLEPNKEPKKRPSGPIPPPA